jgi:hypothetical protein
MGKTLDNILLGTVFLLMASAQLCSTIKIPKEEKQPNYNLYNSQKSPAENIYKYQWGSLDKNYQFQSFKINLKK